MPERAARTERPFACRFHAGEAVIPVIRASTSCPAPDAARAFEHDLARAREALRRRRDQVHPPKDCDDDLRR